jgi:ABC-type dipeptide/oligopeptide/nickel transport system ATPase component
MLRIENLSVDYYRRGKTVAAVRDASLSLGAGETLGLVGESGSGKSTMALAVLRLIEPQDGRVTSGKILFSPAGGQEIDLLAIDEDALRPLRGKAISMIFQDPFTALNPVMRIEEQLKEVLQAHHIEASLSDALRHVQLEPGRVLQAYPHQLSGGQRQRVMIASAILTRPQVLLADEPTTSLDVLVQKDILDLLFSLQKEMGMAVLLISHNLGLVAEYTQRIAVMKEGRIVEEGSPRQLFQQPREPYTRELIASLPAMTRGGRGSP